MGEQRNVKEVVDEAVSFLKTRRSEEGFRGILIYGTSRWKEVSREFEKRGVKVSYWGVFEPSEDIKRDFYSIDLDRLFMNGQFIRDTDGRPYLS